ncbi:MAG: nicotinate-nucleotide adenylyltransferase [Oscillospiraceae bacterium]|jgi:nicotinate-nucleotide adenylyltransferase|nr:nicotinate-nucleotide adenylyltransferase [Oscillospiraceae bacterium]
MGREYEKIGIYGGTFDPPHLGHVIAVQEVKRELKLDRVLVIPASVPPHKELSDGSATAAQRLEMARLAFSEVKFAEVSGIEIARRGASYTADTLWELHDLYPDALLTLIMGADMFESVHMWKDAEVIFSLAGLCALSRKLEQAEALHRQADFLAERYGASCQVLKNPVIDISSSELRELIRGGAESKYLQPQVGEYIVKNGLYSRL